MKIYSRILLLSFVIGACASSHQPATDTRVDNGQTIIGIVRDTSGAPIKGASVRLEMTSSYSGTTTDASGAFKLEGIPSGTYPIRATMQKYSTDSQTVV